MSAEVTLDERGIPERLRARARAWFAREVAALQRAHGPYWPATQPWLVGCLRAELFCVLSQAGGG